MRTFVLLVTLCGVAAAPALADDATAVAVDAGAAKNLCASGIVPCPAASFLCDDPNVARIERGADGAVLQGVAPGTTLCAVTGSAGNRRILRVTVGAPKPAGTAPAK
jgi:hypothetical protein